MKVLSLDVKSSESELYIPHGSDESQNSKSFKFWAFNFISHMVQMKENGWVSTGK